MDRDVERARKEAASWLIFLDDDPGDRKRQTEFREWLSAAPANAAAWQSVSRTGDLFARVQLTPCPSRHGGSRAASTWFATKLYRNRNIAAAMLVACLVLVAVPTISLRLKADYVTGTAQIEDLRLEDGTAVRLGPDSAIKLAYSSHQRLVELIAGEALFDVTADATRPFVVVTRNATTTVLGTRFDVAIFGQSTSVSVSRGHVRIDAKAGRQALDLRAGDWIRVKSDGLSERGKNLPEFLATGPDGRIAARNRPVAEMIDRVRPWFNGRIVVANGNIGRHLVTGVFDATDPQRALQALVGPQGGRVTVVAPWLLIVSRD